MNVVRASAQNGTFCWVNRRGEPVPICSDLPCSVLFIVRMQLGMFNMFPPFFILELERYSKIIKGMYRIYFKKQCFPRWRGDKKISDLTDLFCEIWLHERRAACAVKAFWRPASPASSDLQHIHLFCLAFFSIQCSNYYEPLSFQSLTSDLLLISMITLF